MIGKLSKRPSLENYYSWVKYVFVATLHVHTHTRCEDSQHPRKQWKSSRIHTLHHLFYNSITFIFVEIRYEVSAQSGSLTLQTEVFLIV